jgi:hypothetical protein
LQAFIVEPWHIYVIFRIWILWFFLFWVHHYHMNKLIFQMQIASKPTYAQQMQPGGAHFITKAPTSNLQNNIGILELFRTKRCLLTNLIMQLVEVINFAHIRHMDIRH